MGGPVTTAGLQLLLTLTSIWGVATTTPRHIIFAFVDHFEPSLPLPDHEVTMWIDDYKTMAQRHVDADGRHPVHSYFVVCEPGITASGLDSTLTRLGEMTYEGYGEIELHLHHGAADETGVTQEEATTELVNILSRAKSQYNARGALLTAEPTPQCRFGFIHGMWALDNSRIEGWPAPHRGFCGVNRELDLLRQSGCYADFTFPAWGSMDPRIANSIFYVTDDNAPASYQNIANVHYVMAGQPPRDELMIIEGPWSNPNIGVYPGNYVDWPLLYRMQSWVGAGVHVAGREDWIFVKVHTHGCAGDIASPNAWDCFFGPTMDRFYADMERVYNDGVASKLHYVSAREMYNIIKAAEAGLSGDPGAYRDFLIPPYANMKIRSPDRYRLISYDPNEVALEILGEPQLIDLCLHDFTVDAVVFEGDDPAVAEPSDALVQAGELGELRMVDATPSRCYRILSPVRAAAEGVVCGPAAP